MMRMLGQLTPCLLLSLEQAGTSNTVFCGHFFLESLSHGCTSGREGKGGEEGGGGKSLLKSFIDYWQTLQRTAGRGTQPKTNSVHVPSGFVPSRPLLEAQVGRGQVAF
jgi:hypothetical protein